MIIDWHTTETDGQPLYWGMGLAVNYSFTAPLPVPVALLSEARVLVLDDRPRGMTLDTAPRACIFN